MEFRLPQSPERQKLPGESHFELSRHFSPHSPPPEPTTSPSWRRGHSIGPRMACFFDTASAASYVVGACFSSTNRITYETKRSHLWRRISSAGVTGTRRNIPSRLFRIIFPCLPKDGYNFYQSADLVVQSSLFFSLSSSLLEMVAKDLCNCFEQWLAKQRCFFPFSTPFHSLRCVCFFLGPIIAWLTLATTFDNSKLAPGTVSRFHSENFAGPKNSERFHH